MELSETVGNDGNSGTEETNASTTRLRSADSEMPSPSNDCEVAEHLPLDPFASSDSQAEEEELTILEPPMSGSSDSCAEEMDSEDDGGGNGDDDDDDDECSTSESLDISSDEAQATKLSTFRQSRRGRHSRRRGGVGRAFRGVGSRNVRTRRGRSRRKFVFELHT